MGRGRIIGAPGKAPFVTGAAGCRAISAALGRCGGVGPVGARAVVGSVLVDAPAAGRRGAREPWWGRSFGAVTSEEDDDARTQEARAFDGALDASPTESVGPSPTATRRPPATTTAT